MNNTDYAFLFFILFVITTVLWWKGEELIELIKEKMNKNKQQGMQGHTERINVMSTDQPVQQGVPLEQYHKETIQTQGKPVGSTVQ